MSVHLETSRRSVSLAFFLDEVGVFSSRKRGAVEPHLTGWENVPLTLGEADYFSAFLWYLLLPNVHDEL